jgi:hypothetical protein
MSFYDNDIIAGFILNKLYLGHYFAKPGNFKHGRHTEVDNMPKGYDPKHHGQFKKIINDLKKQGLVLVFKSTKSEHICAILTDEAVGRGLKLCNKYRNLVALPELDKQFKELKREKS